MINFLLDNVLNASRGMDWTVQLQHRVVRTMTTVRRLVLWKGGRSKHACGALLWYSAHVLWQAPVLIEGAGPQHQVPAELGGGGLQNSRD